MRRFFPWSLLVVLFVAPVAARSEPADGPTEIPAGLSYAQLVETAGRFQRESSWARAQAYFTEALKRAADDEQRRRAELGLLEATWRAEGPVAAWDVREARTKAHTAVYDKLGKIYAEGRPRDDFWVALQTSRADFKETNGQRDHWTERAEVAGYLGNRPPSPAAAEAYVDYLKKALAGQENRYTNNLLSARLIPHLENGARVGANAADRAWCAWYGARLAQNEEFKSDELPARLQARAARWTAAIRLATGTRWETAVRVEDFLWRTRLSWLLDVAPETRPDIPSLLAQVEKFKAALAAEEPTDLTAALDRQLGSLKQELGDPLFLLRMNNRFLPDTPVRFVYGAAGLGRLALSLNRLEPSDWTEPRRPTEGKNPPAPQKGKPVRAWTIDLPDPGQRAWHSDVVDVGTTLPPGFYSLRIRGERPVTGEPVSRDLRFMVSDVLGLTITSSGGSGELLVYAAADGQPVAGAEVRGLACDEHGKKSFRWKGVTDPAGRVALPDVEGYQVEFAALVGGQPVAFSRVNSSRREERVLADVFLDRPLYRPGETARWKLIVREREGGRFVVPAGRRAFRMTVELGDEILVAETKLELNEFGTAHGEIAIPATARPGAARLSLTRAAGNDRDEVELNQEIFAVDNFVPPAVVAQVELASGATSLRPGQEMVVRVSAAYFSGGPVVGAPVECRFTPQSDGNDAADGTAYAAWVKELRQQATKVTTDAQGLAEFRLPLPLFLPEGLQIACLAFVVPEGAQAVNAENSFRVTESGYAVNPLGWKKLRLAGPGEKVVFAARVIDGVSAPAACAVTARLVELRWTEVWLGPRGETISGDEAVEFRRKSLLVTEARRAGVIQPDPRPPGWRNIFARYVEVKVAELAVRSAADGRVEAPFVLPGPGLYQLQLWQGERRLPLSEHAGWDDVFRDSAGRSADLGGPDHDPHEALTLIAADEHTDALRLAPETALVIPRGDLKPDAALRAAVVVPVGTRRAWLTVAGEEEVVTHPVELHGRLGFGVFEHPPQFQGQGAFQLACAFSDGRVETQMLAFPVAQEAPKLQVAVRPRDIAQRPGTDALISLETKNSAGRPVPAELALAVADDAVIKLVDGPPEAEQPSFLTAKQVRRVEMRDTGQLSQPGLELLTDPRPGASPKGEFGLGDDEVITLSPFMISSDTGSGIGYAASTSMAGSRFRLVLTDSASAIAVTTSQFLAGAAPGNPTAMGGRGVERPIEIRRHFSSTAHWAPEIVTDKNGRAEVRIKYPDNLTEWRVAAYAVGADGGTFGRASTLTRTTLPLQARLNLPRFLVTGDTAEASATLVNRTEADLAATAELTVSGAVSAREPTALKQTGITVPKQAEARARWTIEAGPAGPAGFSLLARAGAEGDAMELPLPVMEDGIQQETAATGRLAADGTECRLDLPLPVALDPTRTRVSVQLSPSYAAAMLDSLPYLVDYPYGCVEQTMSRFLPAVVVKKTLTDLHLDAAAVEQRILGRESAVDARRRGKTAGLGRLDEVVDLSLARLGEAQTGGGGFGWWPGAETPDLWMTAYVTWGLAVARDAGIEVPEELADKCVDGLIEGVTEYSGREDIAAFALMALAHQPAIKAEKNLKATTEVFERLYDHRDRLSASGRACLAWAGSVLAPRAQQEVLMRNLENGAERVRADGIGDTVHWGATSGYWRATDGAVETTALTLLALLKLDARNPLIEPAVNWLMLNRRSSHWASTRDTAFAVLALNEYIRQRRELEGDSEIELLVNGTRLPRLKITRESLLGGPVNVPVPPDVLRAGTNVLELHRIAGRGPVYAVALGSAWARSDGVKPAGNLVGVARDFGRNQAQPTLVGTLRITRQPLPSGGSAVVGEEVTARVTLTVPNELEYVMVEVPKPAGCEPLNPLSGWDAQLVRVEEPRVGRDEEPPDQGRPVYREERDDKSVFFLHRVEAGTWEIRFGLRATTAGNFRALPVQAGAMYVPEVRANSDAQRIVIQRGE